MGNDFTPLDIEKLKGEGNRLNAFLLMIVTVTMAVLAVLLFVLIQKKRQPPSPKVIISPTEVPTPTLSQESPIASPSPTTIKVASPSPILTLSPTKSATTSPTISATESAR